MLVKYRGMGSVLYYYDFCLVAKSCLTLCDPMESSPPGLVHAISHARNTGENCRFLLQGIFQSQGLNLYLLIVRWILYHWATREAPLLWFSSVQLLSRVWLFAAPWTAAHQASLSSPTSGARSNSCPLSQWWHPAISSSVVPFSSCPQSLTASGSFPISQLFRWGGQSTRVSASASVPPMNTQDWSPLGWNGWISL